MTTHKTRRWLAGCLLAGLFLSLTEIVLRLIHFHYEPDLEFSYPRPGDFSQLRYDPDVFWTLDPAQPDVNEWGFPGDEILIPKRKGEFRILFLGDSVMQAGYPALVEGCFQQRGYSQVKAVSLAIYGYSSYQGRVLAEKYGEMLEPDLVVVEFGWNDHWLAYGEPDAEKQFHPLSPTKLLWHKALARSRLLQGLAWMETHLTEGKKNPLPGGVRVSAEQYRENLTRIREIFEGKNIPVVFITAPSGWARLGAPEEIFARGFATHAESVTVLHAQYNQIVRETGGEGYVLDLEKQIQGSSAEQLAQFFETDHIHPSKSGSQEIAQWVCAFIQSLAPVQSRLLTR
jgi:lysophospholipase L1-like esterase